jgi:hypothetical protein
MVTDRPPDNGTLYFSEKLTTGESKESISAAVPTSVDTVSSGRADAVRAGDAH